MSIQEVRMASSHFLPTNQLLHQLDENVHRFYRMLTNPQLMLGSLGIGLPNDFSIAISLTQSRLARIPEIKDFGYVRNNNNLKMLAYIDQPNEQVEKSVYTVYGELLDLFPNTDIDIRIVELFGRSKEEMQSLGL